MSAAEGASEASSPEQVSGASERANGGASGSVLQSVFLAALAHSAMVEDILPAGTSNSFTFPINSRVSDRMSVAECRAEPANE